MVNVLCGAHEAAAVGTIFPDETGEPVLHMHAAFGRGDEAKAGCIRAGIVTWHILEIILIELTNVSLARLPDDVTGFRLLSQTGP
jgi:predicted DNA-binding protein with PD1-like motif